MTTTNGRIRIEEREKAASELLRDKEEQPRRTEGGWGDPLIFLLTLEDDSASVGPFWRNIVIALNLLLCALRKAEVADIFLERWSINRGRSMSLRHIDEVTDLDETDSEDNHAAVYPTGGLSPILDSYETIGQRAQELWNKAKAAGFQNCHVIIVAFTDGLVNHGKYDKIEHAPKLKELLAPMIASGKLILSAVSIGNEGSPEGREAFATMEKMMIALGVKPQTIFQASNSELIAGSPGGGPVLYRFP